MLTDRIEPLGLSIPEAAKAISVSERHLRGLIETNQFPVCRVGCRLVVPVRALEKWLMAKTENMPAPQTAEPGSTESSEALEMVNA